mgnify:CR=1 FL=1
MCSTISKGWVIEMRKFIANWRELRQEFGIRSLLDAFLGAFIFGLIVMAPVYIILIQLLIVFMYKVNTMTILLIVATIFFNTLIYHLLKQALRAKKPEATMLVGKVLNPLLIADNMFLLVAGLIILFVFVPLWLV